MKEKLVIACLLLLIIFAREIHAINPYAMLKSNPINKAISALNCRQATGASVALALAAATFGYLSSKCLQKWKRRFTEYKFDCQHNLVYVPGAGEGERYRLAEFLRAKSNVRSLYRLTAAFFGCLSVTSISAGLFLSTAFKTIQLMLQKR